MVSFSLKMIKDGLDKREKTEKIGFDLKRRQQQKVKRKKIVTVTIGATKKPPDKCHTKNFNNYQHNIVHFIIYV